jgi:hypothetical protein
MSVVVVKAPSLDADVLVEFTNTEAMEMMQSLVMGRVSGSRLPRVQWIVEDIDAEPQLRVDAEYQGESVAIEYSGQFTTSRYVVERSGVHWDFWRAVSACFTPSLLARGIIAFHAAALLTTDGVVLLPGSSGTGKSSIAFAARARGATVLASELCYISGCQLLAGNSTMTIDPAGLDRNKLMSPPDAVLLDGRVAVPSAELLHPTTINRVLFPRVAPMELFRRPITARRARMLLYENATSELPLGKLMVQETEPLGPPTMQQLRTVAVATATLAAAVEAEIVEGRPQDVANYLVVS